MRISFERWLICSGLIISFLPSKASGIEQKIAGDQVSPPFPPHLIGDVAAVYALADRVLGETVASAQFAFSIQQACPGVDPGVYCFTLSDRADGKISITGTTASELTAGLGVYLREWCGMTVGWHRGGGSYVFIPNPWPKIGTSVSRSRSVAYSHVSQVCTHSYTLVWHNWDQWERFIDWMVSLP